MAQKRIAVTQREKALLIVLPALAIFIVYTLVFAKAPIQRLKVLQSQVDATRIKLPRPHEIPEAEAKIAEWQQRIAEADTQLVEIRTTLSRIAVSGTNNLERLTGGEDLSALWRRYGLVLLEQHETAEGAEALPVPLQNAASKAQRFRASRVARLWEIRLTGSFWQLQSALGELAESAIPAMPVALEMSESPLGGAVKSWRIRVWQ